MPGSRTKRLPLGKQSEALRGKEILLHFCKLRTRMSRIFCRQRTTLLRDVRNWRLLPTNGVCPAISVGPRSFNPNSFNHSCILTITIIQPCTCRRYQPDVYSKVRPPLSQAPARELVNLSRSPLEPPAPMSASTTSPGQTRPRPSLKKLKKPGATLSRSKRTFRERGRSNE